MLVSDQTIRLTDEEDRLCSLLQQFKQHVQDTEPESPQVECRIAGGWVRDKLLSLPCNDIDLALSNHYGFPFATAFSTFLKDHHPEIPQTRIAKIESNPEQSKHLETAKQDVMGMELDYVNLRKEGYTEGSRIPSMMEFGTPLDDALRRDITINSLFYNVHTRKVEDWTEKGLSDLEEGIIRTPLPPRSTFDDDPLRIIRCVRFASRYGFNLHQDIVAAVKDADIKKSLRERISRERVGIEIEKMFGGKNALLSIQLIESLGIYDSIVFFSAAVRPTFASTYPFSSSAATPAPSATALSAALVLDQLLLSTATSIPPIHPTLLPSRLHDKKERTRLFLAAFATPYRGLTVKPGKTVLSAPETVIKEVMKLSGADASFVGRAFQASEALSLPSLDKFPPPTRRSAIGNLLRQIYIQNPVSDTCWTTSIFWSLIMDLLPHFNAETGQFDGAAASVVELYNTFITEIEALNLPSAIEAKPLIDGKEILALLGLTKGGPILKTSLDLIVTWQLDHPQGTKEEGSAWLKGEYEQGRVVVVGAATSPPTGGGGGLAKGERGGKKKKI